jgi:hypothetical protein
MDSRSTVLDDPQFDISNHRVPFGPVEETPELVELLRVDGWEFSGLMHEDETEAVTYELQSGEWVCTGTEQTRFERHAIEWQGAYTVPGIKDSANVTLSIEYADDIRFTDETSDATHTEEGYILFGEARTDEGEYAGEIQGDDYTNLAQVISDAVRLLAFIRDGMLPAETTTDGPVLNLIEELTKTEIQK